MPALAPAALVSSMPRVSSSIRPGAAVAVAARTPRSAAATAARRSARRSSFTVLKIFAVARRTATAWGCSTGSCSTRASTARHVSRSSRSMSVTRRSVVVVASTGSSGGVIVVGSSIGRIYRRAHDPGPRAGAAGRPTRSRLALVGAAAAGSGARIRSADANACGRPRRRIRRDGALGDARRGGRRPGRGHADRQGRRVRVRLREARRDVRALDARRRAPSVLLVRAPGRQAAPRDDHRDRPGGRRS